GIGGTAVTENGRITSVRDINCINLRIAREICGAADEIYSRCFLNGLSGLIVAGPPSSGKTTVLRDLARQLSGGERGVFAKVFVCDERGEIGAVHNGKVQNDLGLNCDVLTSYPKSEGILIGLRSFSPDIIICDEIATEEEVSAIESGLCSGVHFVLSVHAMSKKDLSSKPIVQRLLETGSFDNVVLLSGRNIGNTENIFSAGDLLGKGVGGDSCWDGICSGGKSYCFEG
ncbi:MAG: stage III sporulation protein AA, partial [Clostridia bacterium]|nr:stage III sporulation protein AA [Clostridia bacterium]